MVSQGTRKPHDLVYKNMDGTLKKIPNRAKFLDHSGVAGGTGREQKELMPETCETGSC